MDAEVWDFEAGGLAIPHPDGHTLCVLMNDLDSGGNYLAECVPGSDGMQVVTRLTPPGITIDPRSVYYTPDGGRIVYMRIEAGGRRQLWSVASGPEKRGAAALVAIGDFMSFTAPSPDGKQVAVNVIMPGFDEPRVRILALDDGQLLGAPGSGYLGRESWHPSGDFIVVASREGRVVDDVQATTRDYQLWAQSVNNPDDRVRLTDLASGVYGRGAVSRDGQWVACAMNSDVFSTIAFVRLDRISMK